MIKTTDLGDGFPEAKEEEASIGWRKTTIIAYYFMHCSVYSFVCILNVFLMYSFSCENFVSSDMPKHITGVTHPL